MWRGELSVVGKLRPLRSELDREFVHQAFVLQPFAHAIRQRIKRHSATAGPLNEGLHVFGQIDAFRSGFMFRSAIQKGLDPLIVLW